MLDPNAFLRKLPHVLDPTQRIFLEAIVFSTDAMDICFNRILATAQHYRLDIFSSGDFIKKQMIMDSWAIVDFVHNIRQSLFRLGFQVKPGARKDFFDNFEAATLLRNAMDHIGSNARNIANRKVRLPIYGVLGYLYFPGGVPSGGQGNGGNSDCYAIALSSGRAENGTQFPIINPHGLEIRGMVCQFKIDAFSFSLNLEEAIVAARAMIDELNARAEDDITSKMKELVDREGGNLEELLHHGPVGTSICLKYSFENGG